MKTLLVSLFFLAQLIVKAVLLQAQEDVSVKRDLVFLASGREEKLDLYQPVNHTDEFKKHRLFEQSREEMPDKWRKASPVNYIVGNCPTTFILHGTKDTTVDRDQSTELYHALQTAGGESKLNLIEEAGHAWPLKTEKFDLRPDVVTFFERHLKRTSLKNSRPKPTSTDSKQGQQSKVYSDKVDKITPRTVRIKHSPLSGIGAEPGVMRRDPSDIIKVGDLYYVWYSKGKISPGYDATVWYATSLDGHTWVEKGMALAKGKSGSWEGGSVFTPNILMAEDKYWLFFTGVTKAYKRPYNPDSKIGIAVSNLPDGPWERLSSNPVLRNSENPEDFDSHLVDDACMIVRDGKYWFYYKGRQLGKSPAETKLGVAIADRPQGPYVKYAANPVIPGNHEVLVWPQGTGVAAMIGTTGPEEIINTIQFAKDGIHFSKTHDVIDVPHAAGAYRPEAFTQSGNGNIPEWGVEIGRPDLKNGELPFIQRFDLKKVK